jgi:hypothetical protein
MRTEGALAVVVGTVVGALVLAGLGATALLIPCDEDGLECLGVAVVWFFASSAGFVLGSLVGCYVALRVMRHVRAGATLGALVGLGVLATLVCSGLALAGVPAGAFAPIGLACWIGLPLLARWVVVTRLFVSRSISDGSSDILGSPPAEETPWTSSTAPKRKPSRRRSGSS